LLTGYEKIKIEIVNYLAALTSADWVNDVNDVIIS